MPLTAQTPKRFAQTLFSSSTVFSDSTLFSGTPGLTAKTPASLSPTAKTPDALVLTPGWS